MNILITGGTGYLGSHAVNKLRKKHKIFVLDKTSDRFKLNKIKKKCEFFSGSVNYENLNYIFNNYKIDIVLHFGGAIKQKTSNNNIYFKDLKSTILLINLIKNFKIKYLIFASSCDVYGKSGNRKISESKYCKPLSQYGKNKFKIERKIIQKLKNTKTKYFILRIFNILGFEKNIYEKNITKRKDLISNIVKSHRVKKPLNLYGYRCKTFDGSCVRDYVYIKKFTRIIELLISKLKYKNSDIINIGSSEPTSNLQLINLIEKKFDIKINLKKNNKKKKDVTFLVANNNKLKRFLKIKDNFFNNKEIFLSYKKFFT